MRVVVALGGNALLRRGERLDAFIQLGHVQEAARALAPLAREHEVVVCHGNGPQVGLLAMESEDDRSLTSPYPLDALDAQTQGMIGYWLQRELVNAGTACDVATLITQTRVDPDDPAFGQPTKFIGPGYPRDRAEQLGSERGWAIAQDGSTWRRVVPSPLPIEILEVGLAKTLLAGGALVICGGGGGAAVTRNHGLLSGVEAVVDKDLVAGLLAQQIEADLLLILTDVEGILLDYGTPGAHLLTDTTPAGLQRLSLASGSMGPKAEAAAGFVRRSGKNAAIGTLDAAVEIVAGSAGTQVRPDEEIGR